MAAVVPFVETCIYIGQAVGALIVGLVGGINDSDHAAERQFTQNMCDQLRAAYPSKNIMIVHPNYAATLSNVQSAHVECPITWPRTQGYTCLSFDAGAFQLQGDGGFENWCFNGNYTNNGNGSVTFRTIDVTPPPTPAVQLPPPPPPKSPSDPSDGVYLVNSLKNGRWTSGMAYYRQMRGNGGNNGQQPSVYIDIKTDGTVTWEGGVQQGVFPDGDRFSAWIGAAADVAKVATFHQVGWAANAYRPMNVYRDQWRVLYEIDGWQVYTVYYCT
ncbi:hypothetical protein MMC34_006845 [Xylographa carneopallida]|nr:hypothetical protein [Xylographa carneopallida]